MQITTIGILAVFITVIKGFNRDIYFYYWSKEAATEGGKVIPGTKTDEFIQATEIPVYVPLSGRTMEFDRFGKCITGC
ncbi:hypothetical protein [Myxosarcina sp. GI1]|uniref:hypothetical protein n=1 Tax=Myxosarcina sp. GI1 TaxID=1541065 RepID=UPI0012E032DF|nr:hypothetical protein [Myxosarcina sp. GI1]